PYCGVGGEGDELAERDRAADYGGDAGGVPIRALPMQRAGDVAPAGRTALPLVDARRRTAEREVLVLRPDDPDEERERWETRHELGKVLAAVGALEQAARDRGEKDVRHLHVVQRRLLMRLRADREADVVSTEQMVERGLFGRVDG